MADAGFVIAAALRKLTEDLRLLERQLQTAPLTDLAALHEFRQALDEMRMTAWTVTELHIAQSDKKEAWHHFLLLSVFDVLHRSFASSAATLKISN